MAKKIKVPVSLGAAVDMLYQMRATRLALASKVKDLKSGEAEVKTVMMKRFGKDKLEGAAGKIASMSITPNDVPTVKDWQKVFAYVKKTGSFDLFQRRLSDEAVKLRWDAGKSIPGVDVFHDSRISVTKRSKK